MSLFEKFIEASKHHRPTELEKLEFLRGYYERSILRTLNRKYQSKPGVYGTAAAEYSQDRFSIQCLKEEIEKIDKQIDILKNQLQNAEN